MTVYVKKIAGLAMAARAESNHWISMDGPASLGGMEAGSRPMEVLLMALGGCTGMDVMSILRKKRVPVEDFEMEIESERAEEHPRVYTEVLVVYRAWGERLKPEKLRRAVGLSEEKFCSVSAMLKEGTRIRRRLDCGVSPS